MGEIFSLLAIKYFLLKIKNKLKDRYIKMSGYHLNFAYLPRDYLLYEVDIRDVTNISSKLNCAIPIFAEL